MRTVSAGTILDEPLTVGRGITTQDGEDFTGGVSIMATSDGLLDLTPPVGNAAMIFDSECDFVNVNRAPRDIRRATTCRVDQD